MLSALRLRGLALTHLVLLAFLLAGPAQSAPKDWTESDWVKYIETAILVTLDKAHGGIEGIAGYTPVAGRLPLIDAYSALSATGSSVKPALIFWLNKKMQEAENAEDYDRLNGYQAHLTAVSTGDRGPVIKWEAKKKSERRKAEEKKSAESLFLHKVLAAADDLGRTEIVCQFTVNIFEEEEVRYITYDGILTGPQTTIPVRGTLNSTKGSGYQAAQIQASGKRLWMLFGVSDRKIDW